MQGQQYRSMPELTPCCYKLITHPTNTHIEDVSHTGVIISTHNRTVIKVHVAKHLVMRNREFAFIFEHALVYIFTLCKAPSKGKEYTCKYKTNKWVYMHNTVFRSSIPPLLSKLCTNSSFHV